MTVTGWRASGRDSSGNLPAQRNMRFNSLSLIAANLLTGVLGLGFWAAAARMYPAEAVGVGAAVISSATMLSILSLLSIDTLYERFLPVAGYRAGPLLVRGFLVVAAMALLAGIALIIFGPRESLFESGWQMVAFPFFVVVLAMFTMLDRATTGLGVARWAAAKNAVHAVVKLGALLAFAWTASSVSIVLSWVGTAAVAVVIVAVAMRRRVRTQPEFMVPPALPSNQEVWRYFGSSWGLTAIWAIHPLVVPLIVLTKFGAVANAHFAVTWAIVNAFYTTVHLVLSPYVSEVAAHPDKAASLTGRMVRMMVAVNVLGSLGILAVGPLVLGLVGAEYRAEGQGLLYLSALFVPLAAVSGIYEGIARIRRKLGPLIAVRGVATAIMIGGSVVATSRFGVTGVGWAYLVAEMMCALVLIVPVVRWIRRLKADPEWLAAPPVVAAG